MKLPTSFRLSERCLLLLRELAEAKGISRTDVVEEAIRAAAQRQRADARAYSQEKPSA